MDVCLFVCLVVCLLCFWFIVSVCLLVRLLASLLAFLGLSFLLNLLPRVFSFPGEVLPRGRTVPARHGRCRGGGEFVGGCFLGVESCLFVLWLFCLFVHLQVVLRRRRRRSVCKFVGPHDSVVLRRRRSSA